MSKLFGVIGFFILSAFVVVCAYGNDCNCDDELEAVQNAKIYEIVSDYLIGLAYFSIPLELLYFVSRSNIPFKWVLIQFVAFIVLCGLTHVLNAMTYHEQYKHSFLLVVSLTLAKLFTALVSCATAITLLTLIPLLLKWKVREFFLRQNVLELDQEVGMMKKQEEASWHVRMLTREIRKSLDKHTILYTTLVELSKTLDLFNCAVWMPNEDRTEMKLMYELKSNSLKGDLGVHIPINDPDVLEIRGNKGVRILRVESALGVGSGGGTDESGAVAAIRMPMLRVSNFKGGTPELIDTCYAILVLVLPNTEFRTWTDQEMEIVEVVADQVAVALSHASVLEESQLMREQLSEKNRALQQAQNNAVMATQARNSFQKVMSRGMRRPMYSILGLLSIFHHENLTFNQRIIVDTLVRTSNVLSTLVNDVMEIAAKDDGRFPLEMKPFRLHSMIKEVSCLAKCLTAYRGFGFELDVQTTLPDLVLGDERRAFQVILHMVGYLLNAHEGVGTVAFRVSSESNYEDKNDRGMVAWRSNVPTDYAHLKFEIEIKGASSESVKSLASTHMIVRRHNSNEVKESLSFRMCKRLVQMMQGNIWITPNAFGSAQRMTLVLRFQIRPSFGTSTFGVGNTSEQPNSNSHFRGLRVILADDDDVNRTVTKKLLEKLGCDVTAVSSGFGCLSAISMGQNTFQIVILDLHMPEMDGYEVAARIRKFCSSHNRPLIIALTASTEENVSERCLKMGMNGLIRKPVLLQGMADELRRVLQQAGEGI